MKRKNKIWWMSSYSFRRDLWQKSPIKKGIIFGVIASALVFALFVVLFLLYPSTSEKNVPAELVSESTTYLVLGLVLGFFAFLIACLTLTILGVLLFRLAQLAYPATLRYTLKGGLIGFYVGMFLILAGFPRIIGLSPGFAIPSFLGGFSLLGILGGYVYGKIRQ